MFSLPAAMGLCGYDAALLNKKSRVRLPAAFQSRGGRRKKKKEHSHTELWVPGKHTQAVKINPEPLHYGVPHIAHELTRDIKCHNLISSFAELRITLAGGWQYDRGKKKREIKHKLARLRQENEVVSCVRICQ